MDGVTEDVACSILERIIPETNDVNTIDNVMNSADKIFSSEEEPELRPTSAREADTNRVDEDSDDKKRF